MSDKIPLPEDTTESTENGLDQRKPHPLPHQAAPEHGEGANQHSADRSPREEHPLSVGKP